MGVAAAQSLQFVLVEKGNTDTIWKCVDSRANTCVVTYMADC